MSFLGLGSQSDMGIGISIGLQDHFTPVNRKVLQGLKDLRDQSNSLIKSNATAYRNQALGIAAAGTMIMRSYDRMAKAAFAYGHQINKIDIIGEGKLGKTKESLNKMMMGLSKQFITSPSDVAKAAFENVKAGVTGSLAEITKYQLAVAKATDEPVERIADNLLGIQKAFDLTNDKFKDVANGATAVANATLASVESIAAGMGYAAFQLKQYNVPLAEAYAMIAKIQDVRAGGPGGTQSGTYLKNLYQYMGKAVGPLASPNQSKAFKMMGVDQEQKAKYWDMFNHGRGLEAILDIDRKLTKLPPTERQTILANLANMRGAQGAMALFGGGESGKSVSQILDETVKGMKSDISIRQAIRMTKDPDSRYKLMGIEWEQTKIKFINKATPALLLLMDKVTAFAGWLGKVVETPLGGFMANLIAVVAPLTTIIFGFKAAMIAATLAFRGYGMGARNAGFKNVLGSVLGMHQSSSAMGIPTLNQNHNTGTGGPTSGRAGRTPKTRAWQAQFDALVNQAGTTAGGKHIIPKFTPTPLSQPLPPNFFRDAAGNIKHVLSKNAYGHSYVTPGASIDANGKTYKGGQRVPGNVSSYFAANPFGNATYRQWQQVGAPYSNSPLHYHRVQAQQAASAQMAAQMASQRAATAASRQAAMSSARLSAIGSAGTGLKAAGAMAANAIPIIGQVVSIGLTLWLIYDVVKGIWGETKKKPELDENTLLYKMYERAVTQDLGAYESAFSKDKLGLYDKWSGTNRYPGMYRPQTINISIDNQRAIARTVRQEADDFHNLLNQ